MMSNIIDWENRYWDRQSLLECGWLETVDLDDIGKLVSKFDTGNGAKAVIHADEITEKAKRYHMEI